ncbi:MAG: glycosyltransferase family 4 protein [Oscillospiraceae bacterium]|jgi:glycosyltransferase involved in cell wall biosynthesis|nr:glycosyltransferase family 4 protein [Oscillospiraceae bacterium]
MPHIAIVNQQYPPETAATGQLVQQMARSLAKSGRFESVTVVCGRAFYDGAGGEAAVDSGGGVIVRRLWNTAFPKSSIPGKLFNQLTFMLALLFWRIPKDTRVMVTTAPPLAAVVLAAKSLLSGFDLYMSAQDLYPDVLVAAGATSANGPLCRVLRAAMRWAMRSCRRVAAISTDMAARLRVMYGLEGVRVIPNPALEQVEVLRKSAAPPFVAQYSGNFGVAHEYNTLLGAMRLLSGNDGILFQVAGGGSHYDAIKKEAAGLPNVVFEGYAPADQLSERLSQADISVVVFDDAFRDALLPSKYAGILASGRPVLLISGRENDITRDIQRDGVGLSFNHGQSDAIAQALAELAARPQQARAMGRKARALYDRAYNAEMAYARYAEMLSE